MTWSGSSGGGGTHESDEPVEREGGGAVVRAVVEGRYLLVLPARAALLEEGTSRRVQGTDWLANTAKASHSNVT